MNVSLHQSASCSSKLNQEIAFSPSLLPSLTSRIADFVVLLFQQIALLVTRSLNSLAKADLPEIKPLERPVIQDLHLSCDTSIHFNPHTQRYTLVSPAPRIKNLVISGGGAKGVILPGVIRAFEEHQTAQGISMLQQLDHVAGTSIGAVTALLIACGMSSKKMREALEKEDFKALLGKGRGPILKDGKPLLQFMRKHIQASLSRHLLEMFQKQQLQDVQESDIESYVRQQLKAQHKDASDEHVQTLVNKLKEVLSALQTSDLDQFSFTFSMLKALHQLNPQVFKDITIAATCRENGQTLYFDADKTPDLDMALAARASSSLPVVLLPVTIERQYLVPGYQDALPEVGNLTFNDGGYFDNIPVEVLSAKQDHLKAPNRGENKQNLQTLVLVYDTAHHRSHQQSAFLNATRRKHTLYNASNLVERFVRDILGTYLGGIKTKRRNTVVKEEKLETIRSDYSQRCIPLRINLDTRDFDKAKALEKEFEQKGYEQGKEYLDLHEGELIARSFSNFQDLLDHLPHHLKEAHGQALTEFELDTSENLPLALRAV